MENITLGQISAFFAFFVSLIGSIEFLSIRLSKKFKLAVKEEIKPLTNQNRMQFRHEIVTFANDLQKGKIKTRDEFNSIYELIDEYENICKNLDIKNHLFKESLLIIDEEYKKLK